MYFVTHFFKKSIIFKHLILAANIRNWNFLNAIYNSIKKHLTHRHKTEKRYARLYTEKYKTLLQEIKEDLNKWRDILGTWIGRLSIVKTSILLDLIQRTNAIPNKITESLLLFLRSWGNSNPLQYSCPQNPKDRGAWQAAIHGVTKSQTWLSDWASTHRMATLSDSSVKELRNKMQFKKNPQKRKWSGRGKIFLKRKNKAERLIQPSYNSNTLATW